MGTASFGLEIRMFCDFRCSVLLLNAILGLDFSGLSRPQVSYPTPLQIAQLDNVSHWARPCLEKRS
jgi:hypothetical protein